MLDGLVNALQSLESDHHSQTTDVDNLIKQNPLLAGLLHWVLQYVCSQMRRELSDRIPAPEEKLFDYEGTAEILKKNVPAVRQMKTRGQIIPIMRYGRPYFTLSEILRAKAEMEVRDKQSAARRRKNVIAITTSRAA